MSITLTTSATILTIYHGAPGSDGPFQTLTTMGSSGTATLTDGVLNIPTPTAAGLGAATTSALAAEAALRVSGDAASVATAAADATSKVAAHAALTDAHSATALNTASRIVARNAQGTAALSGVQIDTAATPTQAMGLISWDATEETIQFGVNATEGVSVGVELSPRYRNTSGSTMTNATAVYVTGATGSNTNVGRAKADALATCRSTIGIVTTDAGITNNGFGRICTYGVSHNHDTSAYTAGDTLWVSTTTAGAVTNVEPTVEGTFKVRIGTVQRAHATQGEIFVDPAFFGSVTGDAVSNAISKSAARTAIDAASTEDVSTKAPLISPFFGGDVQGNSDGNPADPANWTITSAGAAELSAVELPDGDVQGQINGKLAKASNLSDVASASTAFANIKQSATSSATGVVELATPAEVITGTSTTLAVTPEGNKAALDARLASISMVDAIRFTGVGGGFQSSIGAFGTGNYYLTGFARVDTLSGTQTIRGGASGSLVLSVNSSGFLVISKQGTGTVATSSVSVIANAVFFYSIGRSGTGSNLGTFAINSSSAGTFTDATDYTAGITMLGETGSAADRLIGITARCAEFNFYPSSLIRSRILEGVGIVPAEVRRGRLTNLTSTNWALSAGTSTVSSSSSTGFTVVNSSGSVAFIAPTYSYPALAYPAITGQQFRFVGTITGTIPADTKVGIGSNIESSDLSSGSFDITLTSVVSQANAIPAVRVPNGSNFTITVNCYPLGALSVMDNASENAGLQLPDVSGNNKWFDLTSGGAIIINPGEFGRINFRRTSTGYLGLGYTPMLIDGYAIDRIKVWADGSMQMGVFDTGADYLASFTPAATEDESITYAPLRGGRANEFPSIGLKLNTATFAEGCVYLRRFR